MKAGHQQLASTGDFETHFANKRVGSRQSGSGDSRRLMDADVAECPLA